MMALLSFFYGNCNVSDMSKCVNVIIVLAVNEHYKWCLASEFSYSLKIKKHNLIIIGRH